MFRSEGGGWHTGLLHESPALAVLLEAGQLPSFRRSVRLLRNIGRGRIQAAREWLVGGVMGKVLGVGAARNRAICAGAALSLRVMMR